MKSTETFERLTARSLGMKGLEWVDRMVARWGDERVAEALETSAKAGKLDKLLHRTSDRLAVEDIGRRSFTPQEVSGLTLLDVARGEIPEPARPYVYDTRDLSSSEYTEVMRWKEREAEAR